MENPSDIAEDTGLKFFGRISASISHELKNAISIINENAGLLEDLTAMAQKGAPLDPNRLQVTAKRIQQQVGRADAIIKNMNTFSHSIDRPLNTVDIQEVLGHFLAITRRITEMRGIQVACEDTSSQIMVTTSPFFLQALLWHTLDFATGVAGDSKQVILSVTRAQQTVTISFTSLKALMPEQAKDFPGVAEIALINRLSAKMAIVPGSIQLALPQADIF